MKRIVIVSVTIICITMLLAGCQNSANHNSTDLNDSNKSNIVDAAGPTATDASSENSEQNESDGISYNDSFVADDKVEDSTANDESTNDMPEPFLNNGGDYNMAFYSTVDLKLGYIDMMFIELVDSEEYNKWINDTTSSNGVYTSVDEAANLYSFVKYFNIPDDTVREILVTLRMSLDDDFTDEDINILLSDDIEAIAEHFSSDTAIRKGANLYSMNWIYTHSIADYERVGITVEDIKLVMPLFDECGLQPEARLAIETKMNDFVSTK